MPTLERASALMPIHTAADDDVAPGHVRALVSAYGVKYRIGWAEYHTIEATAFDDAIAEQATLPFFWEHSWQGTQQAPIGHGDISGADDGLLVDGPFYVDLDPQVARIHAAMQAGALREWSIGYRVIEYRVDADDPQHFYVTKAALLEASVVLRGANPETQTLQVASQILGRDLTPEEAARLMAGRPNPLGTQTAPEPAPAPEPEPPVAAAPDLDLSTVRKLYHRA